MNGDAHFVAPSFSDWQAHAPALTLRRQGRELVGPCPSCGGIDRFAVKPVEGGAAVIHCRQCKGFVDILRAAGLAEDRPTNGAAPVMVYEYRDPSGNLYHRVSRQGEGPDKRVWQDKGHKGHSTRTWSTRRPTGATIRLSWWRANPAPNTSPAEAVRDVRCLIGRISPSGDGPDEAGIDRRAPQACGRPNG